MDVSSAVKQAVDELLDVHEFERKAHFENDVEAMMRHQADHFTAIGDGVIHHLSGEDMRQNFVKAFDRATYHEFDDVEAPQIHVSDDGSFAWMAVRIRVRKTQIDANEKPIERAFVSTAIRTYEKRGGHWLRTGTSGNNVELRSGA